MNTLSTRLGLPSGKFSFHDVWSLHDAGLLQHIPRPCLALLAIIPLTPSWAAARASEDANLPDPDTTTSSSTINPLPVLWFPQTIGNACGSIGLLHILVNSPPVVAETPPGSTLDELRRSALALPRAADRASLLYNSDAFEAAHASVASLGDTTPPTPEAGKHTGQHFVAFVKGADGHLWELEGSRKGPLDRGPLGESEDLLSPTAIARGIGRIIDMEATSGGDLRFSVIALSAAS